MKSFAALVAAKVVELRARVKKGRETQNKGVAALDTLTSLQLDRGKTATTEERQAGLEQLVLSSAIDQIIAEDCGLLD